MALNPRLVTEIIRQKLGTDDDNIAARVAIQIPEALKATARKVAADPDLRQLLITDRSATTAAIASGVVDLTTPYSSFRFLMEYFDLGLVYLLPSSTVTVYSEAATQASGTWTFIGNPSDGASMAINGLGSPAEFYVPEITVAGSGTGTANASYVYRGIYNGRRFYNKAGEAVNPLVYSIGWNLDTSTEAPGWYVTGSAGELLYNNNGEDVGTPDLSAEWVVGTGTAPAPTSVTAFAGSIYSIPIGLTVAETVANFLAILQAETDVAISVASYTSSGNVVTGTYRTAGAAGNAFSLANSSDQTVIVSGATFTGGADSEYRLSVPSSVVGLENLVRVRFTTTTTLPTGITSSSTDYWITDYTPATTGDRGTAASFTISSVATGLTPNPITSLGSGVLTMSLMDADGVPLQRLRSPQQSTLGRYLSSVFTYFYLQGNEIFILPASIAGSVAFAVPSYPTNLAAMPESEETEKIFLEELLMLVAGGGQT